MLNPPITANLYAERVSSYPDLKRDVTVSAKNNPDSLSVWVLVFQSYFDCFENRCVIIIQSKILHLFFFQLYGDFADIFMLAECKLAIVHCAGHYDPTLIETLWREIIDKGNTFLRD